VVEETLSVASLAEEERKRGDGEGGWVVGGPEIKRGRDGEGSHGDGAAVADLVHVVPKSTKEGEEEGTIGYLPKVQRPWII
jgi:hypothetical protein